MSLDYVVMESIEFSDGGLSYGVSTFKLSYQYYPYSIPRSSIIINIPLLWSP